MTQDLLMEDEQSAIELFPREMAVGAIARSCPVEVTTDMFCISIGSRHCGF